MKQSTPTDYFEFLLSYSLLETVIIFGQHYLKKLAICAKQVNKLYARNVLLTVDTTS